ncbi:flagellar brake protein [Motilimonas sp. 1_MG-2023]|uniref:flagellar brake protein n=1 Tax=Motilimonas sp. 1_MG-2023 TaxID=3062672 RepID=UPI0026E17D39|nr:flagellar brake protein [Motilimonas sp. 1_MG-2023]MDO6524296.1 flagellar brake protein [Motilimonas sp. 1_MG-2023]
MTQIDDLAFLRPGMMLHVEAVTPAGVRSKMKLPLIGFQAGDFLLLQYPDPSRWGDKYDVLREGYELIVRVLAEDDLGSVVAFKCQILPTVTRPIKMLVASYPKVVQQQPLRAERRMATKLLAKVRCGTQMMAGQLLDISVHGCRVRLVDPVQNAAFKGQQMTIMVENANKSELFKLLGVVCNQKEESGLWSVGIKLDQTASQNIEKLFEKMLVTLDDR